MGKKKFYIIILGLIILLTGCGKEEKENLGDNYILGKDNQYYFSGNYLMTESENAYYFLAVSIYTLKIKVQAKLRYYVISRIAFIIKKRLVRFLWTGIYVKEDVKRIIA